MLYVANRCFTESALGRGAIRGAKGQSSPVAERSAEREARSLSRVRVGSGPVGSASRFKIAGNSCARKRDQLGSPSLLDLIAYGINNLNRLLLSPASGWIFKMIFERRRRFHLKRLFPNSPIRFFVFVFDPKKVLLTSSGFLSLSIKKSHI